MKTKAFILVCLLVLVGVNQLSAQNAKGSGTIHYGTNDYTEWYAPVYCGDEMIDLLYAPVITVTAKDKLFKDGTDIWMNRVNNQEAVSQVSGETFKLQGADHWYGQKGYCQSSFHLIGTKGSNYTMILIFDTNTMEILEVRAHCE